MIELRQEAALPLALVRRKASAGELSRIVPECCGLVWNALKSQGIRGGRQVAIYLDSAINVEIGAEVAGPFRAEDGLMAGATPAGECASAVHLGPYGTLGRTHAAIIEWCRAQGRRVAGPRWEVYGHWEEAWNAHPERIRTDVHYLLEPAASSPDISRNTRS